MYRRRQNIPLNSCVFITRHWQLPMCASSSFVLFLPPFQPPSCTLFGCQEKAGELPHSVHFHSLMPVSGSRTAQLHLPLESAVRVKGSLVPWGCGTGLPRIDSWLCGCWVTAAGWTVSNFSLWFSGLSIRERTSTFQGCLGGSVCQASAFSSGHELEVLGSSPAWGSLLNGEPVSPSPSPSACHPPARTLSSPLSEINK